jgi:PAS domain-containing protein
MEKTRRRESLDMRIGDKWFQVTVDPILDENGDIERTVHIIRDITRQKSIEEELKKTSDRFRAMIDTAPYGAHLYELTADGRLVFTGSNKSADSILCVDNSQFIGKTIEEAFPNLAATEIPTVYKSALSRPPRTTSPSCSGILRKKNRPRKHCVGARRDFTILWKPFRSGCSRPMPKAILPL